MDEQKTFHEITITGWKGKSGIELYESPSFFKVKEFRKTKESGEVVEEVHEISREQVQFIWDLIRNNCDLGEKYGYRFLVRKVIDAGKMDLSEVLPSFTKFNELISKSNYELQEAYKDFLEEISIEVFNGGKFRKTIYFPVYYSLKILEALDFIIFYGRGGIARLSEEVNVR